MNNEIINYTTNILFDEWEDGDMLCVDDVDSNWYGIHICEVRDSKLFDIEMNEYIIPKKQWKFIRIDYKFISDGTWYVEGTEAYPIHMIDSEDCSGVFRGLTYYDDSGSDRVKLDVPIWDGESCSMDEFKVVKRLV